MPTFIVRSPAGEEFEVTGPNGGTQEQAISYVQQNYEGLKKKTAYEKAVKERAAPTGEKTSTLEDVAYGVNEYLFKPLDRAFTSAAGALGGKSASDQLVETELADASRKKFLGIQDYNKKDPGTVGKITAGVAGVAPTIPLRVPAQLAMAGLSGAGSAENFYNELRKEGVDQRTALAAAGLMGVSAAATTALPSLGAGAKATSTAALGGAATNAGQNAATNYAIAQLLAAAGYKELAQKYTPTLEQGVVDAAVGAFGAGAGRMVHKKEPAPKTTPKNEQLDAEQQAYKDMQGKDVLKDVNRALPLREKLQKQEAERQAALQRQKETQRTEVQQELPFGQMDIPFPSPDLPMEKVTKGGAANARHSFVETRGTDERFHGTSKQLDKLDDNYALAGDSRNIYGQGFYTTDAVDIAHGYSKKGRGDSPSLYGIENLRKNIKLYDMEKPMSPQVKRIANEIAGDYYNTFDAPPKTLREVYDTIREASAQGDISRDEAQGMFDAIRANLEGMKYRGFAHTGGTLTGKSAHKVHIYWYPEKDLKLNKKDFNQYDETASRVKPLDQNATQDSLFPADEPMQGSLFTDEQAPKQAPEGGWPKPEQKIPEFTDKNDTEPQAPSQEPPPSVGSADPVTDKLLTGIYGEQRELPNRANKQQYPSKPLSKTVVGKSLAEWEKVTPKQALEQVLSGQFKDISDSRLKQQMAAGSNIRQILNNNPIISLINTSWRNRDQEMTAFLETHVTGKSKDTIPYWHDKMTPAEQVEILQAMKIADRNGVDLSPEQLSRYSENQQQFVKAWKKAFDDLFVRHNESNLYAGLDAFKERPGYFPSYFNNTYTVVVRDANGNVVHVLGAETKKGLKKLQEQHKAANPDHQFGKIQGVSLQSSAAGYKSGQIQQQLIEYLAQHDSELAQKAADYFKTEDSFRTHGLFQQDLHELTKKGVKGSAGDKYWLSPEENAREMYNAGLQHLEQSIAFSTAQRAMTDVSRVIKDQEVMTRMPNAVEYAQKYSKSAVGIIDDDILIGQAGRLSNNLINWITSNKIADSFGLNPNRFLKGTSTVKNAVTQHMMGIWNLPFTFTQLMQPLQTVTPLLQQIAQRNGGSFVDAVSSGQRGASAAMKAWYEFRTGQKVDSLDSFDRASFQYMRERGIAIFSEMEKMEAASQNKLVKAYNDKIGEANLRFGEMTTRPTAFMMLARAIKDAAGNQYTDKEIFGIADNMTRAAMVDYSKNEKALMFKNMGVVGNFAGALQTFKFGNTGLNLYLGKNAVKGKEAAPFMMSMAAQVALSGVTGVIAFDEADALFTTISKQLVKMGVLDKPVFMKDWILSNLPQIASKGAMSAALGGDISNKFSAANMIPDSAADVLPHAKYFSRVVGEVFEGMSNGMNADDINRILFILAPQSLAGPAESAFNRRGDFTLKRGKGGWMENDFQRTPEEWDTRSSLLNGLKPVREGIEKEKLWTGDQKKVFYADLREKTIDSVVKKSFNGKLSAFEMDRLKRRFIAYGGTAEEFDKKIAAAVDTSKANSDIMKRHMDSRQRKQGELKPNMTLDQMRNYQNYE